MKYPHLYWGMVAAQSMSVDRTLLNSPEESLKIGAIATATHMLLITPVAWAHYRPIMPLPSLPKAVAEVAGLMAIAVVSGAAAAHTIGNLRLLCKRE
jgi:ABC-type sulfate transport system permease component